MLALIEVLVIIFGEEPPVFSRTQHVQQANQAYRNYPGLMNIQPPYPTGNTACEF